MKKAKIGLLPTGHATYWPQFKELKGKGGGEGDGKDKSDFCLYNVK